MNYKKWINLNAKDLTDKTAIVTGSTGGLGGEICKTLALLNCNLIFLNRNLNKSEKQKEDLLKLNPNIKIDIIQLDQRNVEQVKNVANELKYIQFDYFIHNAGVYNVPIKKTSAGYNNIFTTNFVSPYYLTNSLLPYLKENSIKTIVVSSIANNYSKIDENDIDFSSHKKPSKIYGNSKRFLTFALMKLFNENNYSNFAICHPGITLTNMTNHYPKAINWLVKIGIKLLFPNPQKASLNIIKAMFENTKENEWIGPKHFNVWGYPNKKEFKTCKDNEKETIYKIAQQIYVNLKEKTD